MEIKTILINVPSTGIKQMFNSFRQMLLNAAINFAKPIVYQFHFPEPWPYTRKELLTWPAHTFGFKTANYLQQKGFDFFERFEVHDLKHILLEYEMDGPGEVRLQFFLLGNGNKSMPVWTSIAVGILLYPDYYKEYMEDYRRAKNFINISFLDYAEVIKLPLADVQKMIQVKKQ